MRNMILRWAVLWAAPLLLVGAVFAHPSGREVVQEPVGDELVQEVPVGDELVPVIVTPVDTPEPPIVIVPTATVPPTPIPPTVTPVPPTPTPVPPTPIPYGETGALICSYAWDCAQALAIMDCESEGGDPYAFYDNGPPYGPDRGLMGVNYYWHRSKLVDVTGSDDPELLYDPAINVEVAWQVYSTDSEYTWRLWSCDPW